MRLSGLALLAAIALPAATAAQRSVMLEVRPTFAIPVGKLAGASLEMGPAFGVNVSTRVREYLHLYTGWDWAHFGARNSFAGTNRDFEETGYALGLRFERPFPPGNLAAPRVEAGATYKRVTVENPAGESVADSKQVSGYEIAAGVGFALSDEWSLVPMARFRSLRPEFRVGSTTTAGQLRYATIEFTLSRRFR